MKADRGHMKVAQDFWLSNVLWNKLLWFFGRTQFIVQVKFFTVNKMVSCRYWKYLPCQIPQEWNLQAGWIMKQKSFQRTAWQLVEKFPEYYLTKKKKLFYWLKTNKWVFLFVRLFVSAYFLKRISKIFLLCYLQGMVWLALK